MHSKFRWLDKRPKHGHTCLLKSHVSDNLSCIIHISFHVLDRGSWFPFPSSGWTVKKGDIRIQIQCRQRYPGLYRPLCQQLPGCPSFMKQNEGLAEQLLCAYFQGALHSFAFQWLICQSLRLVYLPIFLAQLNQVSQLSYL